MVDAAAIWDDSDTFGWKLTRDEGLAHPQRDEFWALVDFLLVNDPDVALHMGYRRASLRERFARSFRNPRRHP